jgi:hypothetical protein
VRADDHCLALGFAGELTNPPRVFHTATRSQSEIEIVAVTVDQPRQPAAHRRHRASR